MEANRLVRVENAIVSLGISKISTGAFDLMQPAIQSIGANRMLTVNGIPRAYEP
jgi:hypothetical protein